MLDARMEFGFNDERIVNDGEYTVTEIYTLLDETMQREGLKPTSKGIYEGNFRVDGDKFLNVGVILMGLTWFRKYCNMWMFNNPEEGLDNAFQHMKDSNLCL